MRLSYILGGCDSCIHGKDFPMYSVVLMLDDTSVFVCSNFNSKPLELFYYSPEIKKWIKTNNDKYSKIIKEYYKTTVKKHKRKHYKKHYKSKATTSKQKGQKKTIPNNVKWNMLHPLQGGRVSPR